MCRSNELGGRRCPLHSNPTYIANRNERRRAQYAKNKGGKVRDYNKKAVDLLTPLPLVSTENSSIYNQDNHNLFKKYSDYQLMLLDEISREHELYNVDLKSFAKNDVLNIETVKFNGRLADVGYFASTAVSGKINHQNIDENSYKVFGFSAPDDAGGRKTLTNENLLKATGAAEVEELEEIEKGAVRMFTANHFEWVNSALYNQEPALAGVDYEDYMGDEEGFSGNEEGVKRWDGEATFLKEASSASSGWAVLRKANLRTPAALQELTDGLDKATAKSSGRQRVVYRGVSRRISANNITTESESDWVDKNLTHGQEIVFDGYQSTSTSYQQAIRYSEMDDNQPSGVVYEILTPEGLNVVSESRYTEECEVLLPRSSRYMVVGIHKNIESVSYEIPKTSTSKLDAGVKTKTSGIPPTIVQLVAIDDDGEILTSNNRHRPPAVTEEQLGRDRIDI